jgi:hypothetical protein
MVLPMATIRCQDCGEERTRCPSNTRYCKSCRLLRELRWWTSRRRACFHPGCDERFAPVDRADRFCATHNPGLVHQQIDCVLANWKKAPRDPHRGAVFIPGIPVCADCLRAPDMRVWLISALEGGQTQRRERNNATP